MVQPLYATLAERLRTDILTGVLPPGATIPSESALVARHGLARGTVRRAIDELIGEGLVISHNGVGHQVRSPNRLTWDASAPERNTDASRTPNDSWSRSVRAQGRVPSEQITTEIIRATGRVAAWLSLPEGEPVSVRRRLRSVDGEPYASADGFYPRSVAAGTEIELPDDVLPGVFAVYARLGRPWVRTVDTWVARAPSREESGSLRIPRGVSVAEIVRRSFDADGVPIRLTIFVLPGDRHQITYTHSEDAT